MASASCESTAWECTVDYADIDRIELPEIDCSLLTTLLEETAAASDDLHHDCEDCGLMEDMLLDSEEDCPLSPSTMHDDGSFGWVDMDAFVPSSPSHDVGNWLANPSELGMVDYGEDCLLYSYYYGDVLLEDGYSPLWQ